MAAIRRPFAKTTEEKSAPEACVPARPCDAASPPIQWGGDSQPSPPKRRRRRAEETNPAASTPGWTSGRPCARCATTGWDSQPRGRDSGAEGEPRMQSTGGSTPGSNAHPLRREPGSRAEGVGFEPTRPSRVNALAGRRLKPLGHPSENCPAWDRTRTLLIQSQTCCQLHHGAFNHQFAHSPPRLASRKPPVGFEPTTPSLRVTCSTS